MALRKFARDNGLSVVLFGIFAATIIGMSIMGWHSENNDLADHKQPAQSYVSYITSGDFVEAVFENWESEFLQMWALVVLTIFLRQKGSEDSKPMRGPAPQDTSSRYSIINAASWTKRKRAIRHGIYSHSLSLSLLSLFIMSFVLHGFGGVHAANSEAMLHSEETMTVWQYFASSQFWFESLQNWQSEFLAVGTLIVLSIKLRERGSQQSKPVGEKFDRKTGD